MGTLDGQYKHYSRINIDVFYLKSDYTGEMQISPLVASIFTSVLVWRGYMFIFPGRVGLRCPVCLQVYLPLDEPSVS